MTAEALYLTGISLLCFAVVGLMEILAAGERHKRQATLNHLDRLRRENEMNEPTDVPSNHEPRSRVVQTYPGDSLGSGICRARILALEYKVVCLIHDYIAVMVFPGDEHEDIEAEWKETRRALRSLKCEGK